MDYLVCDYDERTSEIVADFDLSEKLSFLRNCGVRVQVTEIKYGDVIIDDTKSS
jgi:hypothetical protein